MTPSREMLSALLLRPRPDWALFLDVDGTLLHLREDPGGVSRDERVCRILDAVAAALHGALALVSGRPIDALDRLFWPSRLPAAGQHGLERRDAGGRRHAASVSAAMDELRRALGALARDDARLVLEEKSHALALHYRRAPGRGAELREKAEALVGRAAPGLQLMHGKMVMEIKPRNADKGSAIRAFMGEAPFSGRVPAFIGDDTTDEDGFSCVNALNGHAIRVGEAADTAARYSLRGVDEAVSWLEAWPRLLRGGGGEAGP